MATAMDHGIKTPLYRETKTLVDNLIRDENFRHSDELYYDERVTWLEVLRVSFAVFMARSSKKVRTPDELRKQVDFNGIQEWLDWVHDVQKGNGTDLFGNKINDCTSYTKSPGINRWKRFICPINNAEIYHEYRHPERRIAFDQIEGTFTDQGLSVNEKVIARLRGITEKVIEGHPDVAFEITHEGNKVKIVFTRGDAKIVEFPEPFSFETDRLKNKLTNNLRSFRWIDPLVGAIHKDISTQINSSNFNYDLMFNLNFRGPPSQDDYVIISINPFFEIKTISHLLESSVDTRNLNGFYIQSSQKPSDALYAYENQQLAKETTRNRVKNFARIEIEKIRRRSKTLQNIGSKGVKTDIVTKRLMEIAARQDPETAQKIPLQNLTTIKIPEEKMEGYAGSRTKEKNVLMTFTISEGTLRSRMHLGKNVLWDKGRLRLKQIPKSIQMSLVGKEAKEILEHPLADLLGKVTKVTPGPNGYYTWLSFESEKTIYPVGK